MAKQIILNAIKGNSGGVIRCVNAHYAKVGVHDMLNANRLPHAGIMIVYNGTQEQASKRSDTQTLSRAD